MSRVRRQNGRTIAASPASPREHGRLAPTSPAARIRIDVRDAAERLAGSLVERALARRAGGGKPLKNASLRCYRARAALLREPGGRDEARRVDLALSQSGGAALRAVERAHPDLREYAARAAVRLVALVREHDVQTTAALLLLASAAQWTAIAEMLRERVLATSPSVLAVAKATSAEDGGRLSLQLGGFGDLLKLAAQATATGRLELLSALELEERSRAAGGGPRAAEGAAALARGWEAVAARRRAREQGAEGGDDDAGGSGGADGGTTGVIAGKDRVPAAAPALDAGGGGR